MPPRIVREGFVDSERINNLDYDEECFYHRLLLKADDAGRYDGRVEILRSTLFPLGYKTHSDPVKRGLDGCQREGLVRVYEVAGKPYLQITNWRRSGNAKISKWPDGNGDFTIRFLKMNTSQGVKEFVDTSVRDSDADLVSPSQTLPHTNTKYGDGDGDGKTRSHPDGIGTPSASHLPGSEDHYQKQPMLKELHRVPNLRSITYDQWLRIREKRSRYLNWKDAIAHVVDRAELKTTITDPAVYVDTLLSKYEAEHVREIDKRKTAAKLLVADVTALKEVAESAAQDPLAEVRLLRMKADFLKQYGNEGVRALAKAGFDV